MFRRYVHAAKRGDNLVEAAAMAAREMANLHRGIAQSPAK